MTRLANKGLALPVILRLGGGGGGVKWLQDVPNHDVSQCFLTSHPRRNHVALEQGGRSCATIGHRKVRVFYERKDPQHTLFCCETLVAKYLGSF